MPEQPIPAAGPTPTPAPSGPPAKRQKKMELSEKMSAADDYATKMVSYIRLQGLSSKVLSADPTKRDKLLAAAGAKKEAIKDLKQAHTMIPNFVSGIQKYDEALEELGDPKKFEDHLTRSMYAYTAGILYHSAVVMPFICIDQECNDLYMEKFQLYMDGFLKELSLPPTERPTAPYKFPAALIATGTPSEKDAKRMLKNPQDILLHNWLHKEPGSDEEVQWKAMQVSLLTDQTVKPTAPGLLTMYDILFEGVDSVLPMPEDEVLELMLNSTLCKAA